MDVEFLKALIDFIMKLIALFKKSDDTAVDNDTLDKAPNVY